MLGSGQPKIIRDWRKRSAIYFGIYFFVTQCILFLHSRKLLTLPGTANTSIFFWIMNSLTLLTVVLLFRHQSRFFRRIRSALEEDCDLCENCLYMLKTGQESGLCPECGWPYGPETRELWRNLQRNYGWRRRKKTKVNPWEAPLREHDEGLWDRRREQRSLPQFARRWRIRVTLAIIAALFVSPFLPVVSWVSSRGAYQSTLWVRSWFFIGVSMIGALGLVLGERLLKLWVNVSLKKGRGVCENCLRTWDACHVVTSCSKCRWPVNTETTDLWRRFSPFFSLKYWKRDGLMDPRHLADTDMSKAP